MEKILAQQHNRATPVTGTHFLYGMVRIVIGAAVAQILVSFLIAMTGIGMLSALLYFYVFLLLFGFVCKSAAGSRYKLKENQLKLESMLGDSVVYKTVIPLERIVSIRPVFYGERLRSSYRRVKVIDASAAQPPRMRLAFVLSLLSAKKACKAAGELSMQMRAHIVVYENEGKRHACVFLPDAHFKEALRERLPDVCDMDERTRENTPVTLWAQALERAFPQLYAHVSPLVSEERRLAALEEIARQKQNKAKKAQKKAKGETEKNKAENAEELSALNEHAQENNAADEYEEEAGSEDEVQNNTL